MKLTEAKVYQNYHNVDGWMVSEKLNGVKGVWDGTTLFSKNGNKFNAPAWFLKELPNNIQLEGELYIGKNQLGKTAGTVRKKIAIDEEWKNIKFMIFDAPSYKESFKQRINYCKKICMFSKFIDVIPHEYISNTSEMHIYYNDLVSMGAEGIIIRDPNSNYEIGRSNGYLKFKPKDDDEAKIIDYVITKKLFSKQITGLICKWKNKTIIISTIFRNTAGKIVPKIGATITFLYQGVDEDMLPICPVYSIIRDYE